MEKNDALNQINGLLDTFKDAKEYGSILTVENYNWDLLRRFANDADVDGQMTLDAVGLPQAQERVNLLIEIGETMARKYEVVTTNPPYMAVSNADNKISKYVKDNYPDSKADLFAVFIERCYSLCDKNCLYSMITQHAWMFLSSYEKLRKKLQNSTTVNMAHLGARAFDEISGEDIAAVNYAQKSGVKVIATAHAKSADELRSKPYLRELLDMGVFENIVFLKSRQNAGKAEKTVKVGDLYAA